MTEIEIWHSEYELRQFIDMAVRWKIEGIYNNKTNNNPFSVFDSYVNNARGNFELFCAQLNKKLNENENWKAIGIDLKDRFLPMINGYLIWYNINKAETEKFEPHNPYRLMLAVIESTQREILKYFPEAALTKKPEVDKKHPICTSKDFKKDISELCNACPLTELISQGIENQILFQANEQRTLLNDHNFKTWLSKEIESHSDAMRSTYLLELQNKDHIGDIYRATRIKNYIWNKEGLKALKPFSDSLDERENLNHILEAPLSTKTKARLQVNQIALIHVYEGKHITRDNAGEIAAKHGFTSKTSGEGLFQDYTMYSSSANRKGKPTPYTQKKLKNKIVLFESLLEHLTTNAKQRAIDEIGILKTLTGNEY